MASVFGLYNIEHFVTSTVLTRNIVYEVVLKIEFQGCERDDTGRKDINYDMATNIDNSI